MRPWGSPARLGDGGGRWGREGGGANLNPSHTFLKAANVSFEEIIPFGLLIAVGHYEPLRGMYGIRGAGYQQGGTRGVCYYRVGMEVELIRFISNGQNIILISRKADRNRIDLLSSSSSPSSSSALFCLRGVRYATNQTVCHSPIPNVR